MKNRSLAPKTVVSLTPLPVAADSRTLREASSVARFGYRSIVVEGIGAGGSCEGAFERISASDPALLVSAAIRDKTRVLRRYRAAGKRQLSMARHAAKEHLNCCAELALDIGSITRELPAAAELTHSLEVLREMIHKFQLDLEEWAGTAQGRLDDASLAAIAGRIALYETKLTGIYTKLDRIAEVRGALERELARCARRPASAKALRGLRRLARRAPHAFRRRLGQIGRVPVIVGVRLRASEPVMFLCHLKEYAARHLFAPLRAAPKASLYYLHSFYEFPAVYLLCLRHRAEFIYDAHDFYSHMYDEASLSHFWRHWVQPLERFVERQCMRKAAAIVTVNAGIAGLIKEHFGRSAIVLRNSHDGRLDVPVRQTIRQQIGLSEDAFLVVSVGQFKAAMALEPAIAAIGRMPSRYHLAFLGGGYPAFDALSERAGAGGRIHFLPPVAACEVVPFISEADAGILLYRAVSPSIENCLPNGFFQLLAARLPLLYPELPEIRRVAEEHGLGVSINPNDCASIVAGLARLGEDREFARRMGANVEQARERLGWERDEAELRRLVEALIGPAIDCSSDAVVSAKRPASTTVPASRVSST